MALTCLRLVPILSHSNSVYTLKVKGYEGVDWIWISFYFNIHIILQSKPRSSEQSLPFRFMDPNFVYISHLPMRSICPAHLNIYILLVKSTIYEFLHHADFLHPQVISSVLHPRDCSLQCLIREHSQSVTFPCDGLRTDFGIGLQSLPIR
jgi:hypothetical protein